MNVLLIEDNPDLAVNILDYLERRGHVVDTARDGITGLHLALVNSYDVIILDLILPRMDGITLCRKLRQEGHVSIPVLILTARDSLDDKVTGLEAGADDYVVKPFALRELEARLQALTRRSHGLVTPQTLHLADLAMDPATLQVTRDGRKIDLPPIPMKILELLLRRAPAIVSRQEIEETIWGDSPPDSDALRAHMHVLRNALDKPFSHPLLHTQRGMGYQLADPHAPAS